MTNVSWKDQKIKEEARARQKKKSIHIFEISEQKITVDKKNVHLNYLISYFKISSNKQELKGVRLVKA